MSNATSNALHNGTVTPPEVEGEVEGRFAPSLPSAKGEPRDEGREVLIQDLVERGIRSGNAPLLVDDWPAERVQDAIVWYDAQRGVGPGVLVAAIRAGRKLAASAAPGSHREAELLDRWVRMLAWLREHLPEVEDGDLQIGGFSWWFRSSQPRSEDLTPDVDAPAISGFIERRSQRWEVG